jgi:hypothetical protein
MSQPISLHPRPLSSFSTGPRPSSEPNVARALSLSRVGPSYLKKHSVMVYCCHIKTPYIVINSLPSTGYLRITFYDNPWYLYVTKEKESSYIILTVLILWCYIPLRHIMIYYMIIIYPVMRIIVTEGRFSCSV